MEASRQSIARTSEQWEVKQVPEMSDETFEKWSRTVENQTGICYTPQRRAMLQTALVIRMRELGIDDYDVYLERVSEGIQGKIEWAKLVDRLTIQETRFFRDPDAMKLVQQYLQKIKRNTDQQTPIRPVKIWSFGCSTGEEPYSLAMLAAHELGVDPERFSITATDLSTPALNKARIGYFGMRKAEHIPKIMFENYCAQDDEQCFSVTEKIKDRIGFSRVNALELKQAPMDSMDVIYCQNLLIYFRKWRRKEILNELVKRLKPGGLLVLGMGEISDWHNELVTPLENSSVLAFVRKKVKAEAEVNE